MAVTTAKPPGPTAIRPFTIEAPDADLADLRRRIAATRWPEKETGNRVREVGVTVPRSI